MESKCFEENIMFPVKKKSVSQENTKKSKYDNCMDKENILFSSKYRI